jgi:predicted PurR-regulated permease PerM
LAMQQPASASRDGFDLFEAFWRTALVFGLAESFEGYYLTPKILGESLGLHPVVVLVSIFAGGAAFGMFGILLALPVTAALVILFRVFVMPALARMADE